MTLTPAPVAPPPADLPDILCIGSVLWDVIGRAAMPMHLGADVPGRITRLPGGVAMNIAMALVRFGLRPAVLTAIGRDADGAALVAACARLGIDTGRRNDCCDFIGDFLFRKLVVQYPYLVLNLVIR